MYYVAVIQNNNTPALFAYNTESEALAAYHTELAYRAEGRTSTVCAILNSTLQVLRNEIWEAEPTVFEQED